MAKRGRPPKPSEYKKLAGNPGNRPIVEPEPEVDVSSGSLRLPSRLTTDEKVIWRELLSCMPDWWWTAADKDVLIEYCRCRRRIDDAVRALSNKPLLVTRANGSPCLNPHYQVLQIERDMLLRLRKELGLRRVDRCVAGSGFSPSTAAEDVENEFGDLILLPLDR